MQIPGHCNYDPETTVAAHAQFEGGIMGGKTDDISTVFGCCGCHDAVDQYLITKEERWFYLGRGVVRTLKRLIELGLIKLL